MMSMRPGWLGLRVPANSVRSIRDLDPDRGMARDLPVPPAPWALDQRVARWKLHDASDVDCGSEEVSRSYARGGDSDPCTIAVPQWGQWVHSTFSNVLQ